MVASVDTPVVKNGPDTVRAVEEADASVVCPVVKRLPDTVSPVVDAVASVVCPVTPRVPATPSKKPGVDDPTPTLPFERTVRKDWLDDEAIVKIGVVVPAVPKTVKSAIGVEDPIPKRVLVLSQKKLALFCDTRPEAPINGIDP